MCTSLTILNTARLVATTEPGERTYRFTRSRRSLPSSKSEAVSDISSGFPDDGPAGAAVTSGRVGSIEASGRMGWDVDSAVGTDVVAGKSVDTDVSSSRVELPMAEVSASRKVPSGRVEDVAAVPACRDVPDGVEEDASASLIAWSIRLLRPV